MCYSVVNDNFGEVGWGTRRTTSGLTGVPRTFGSEPSDPIRLADEPGTWVQVDIAAPLERVWAVVTDIDLPARFSDEFLGATWNGDGPGEGLSFVGRNRHPAIGSGRSSRSLTASRRADRAAGPRWIG